MPPPGWHPDPNDPTQWRWWDGEEWTDKRSPRDGVKRSSGNGVAAGYVMAIVIPIVGFLIGLALLVRDDRNGAPVMGVSLIAGFIYFQIATGGFG
jgi:hypothetical protein